MSASSMVALVANHPYFFANVITFALVALAWLLVSSRRRRFALLSAAAGLPGTLVAIPECDYWQPVCLFPGNLRVEDAQFIWMVSAMVGLLIVFPWPSGGSLPRHPWLRRYLPLASAGILLFVVFLLLGLPAFEASLWAMGIWGAGLLALRPRHIRPALVTALAFTPPYWAIVRMQLLFWPDYIRQWGAAHPLAFLWLGVPAGELIWAAIFGVAWSAFMLFVLEPPAARDARPRPTRRLSRLPGLHDARVFSPGRPRSVVDAESPVCYTRLQPHKRAARTGTAQGRSRDGANRTERQGVHEDSEGVGCGNRCRRADGGLFFVRTVNGQIGIGQFEIEQILLARQMQRAGFGQPAFTIRRRFFVAIRRSRSTSICRLAQCFQGKRMEHLP